MGTMAIDWSDVKEILIFFSTSSELLTIGAMQRAASYPIRRPIGYI
jgi:hypothetical protein